MRLDSGGDLDPGFGSNGMVELANGSRVVSDSTGRLLVATPDRLTRLDLDGHADPSFGNGGSIDLTDLPAPPDEKIVDVQSPATGSIFIVLGGDDRYNFLIRTDESGQPDPAFNGGAALNLHEAVPSIDLSGSRLGPVRALQDGSILVVAPDTEGSPVGTGVYKLLPSGEIDPSFGAGGFVQLSIPSPEYRRYPVVPAIEQRPDGTIVVFGTVMVGSSLYYTGYSEVAQIAPSGATTGFGPLPFTGAVFTNSAVTGAALSGEKTYFSLTDQEYRGDVGDYAGYLVVGRLLSDGGEDPGYGRGGLFAIKVGDRSEIGKAGMGSVATSVATTPSGGAVVGGTSFPAWNTTGDPAPPAPTAIFARTDEKGQRDFTFGRCGVVALTAMDLPDRLGPSLTTTVSRRGQGLRLVGYVRPAQGSSPDCAWQGASLKLPQKLTLRRGGIKEVRVFSGLGPKAKRVPAELVHQRGRTIAIDRAAGHEGDDLRVAIRPAALKKVPRGVRGKRLPLTASYYWAGTNPLSRTTKFKVPRVGTR